MNTDSNNDLKLFNRIIVYIDSIQCKGKYKSKITTYYSDEDKIRSIKLDTNRQEGYVIRKRSQFSYGEFSKSIAKFVRRNHVQNTVHNWKRSKIEQNKIRQIKNEQNIRWI